MGLAFLQDDQPGKWCISAFDRCSEAFDGISNEVVNQFAERSVGDLELVTRDSACGGSTAQCATCSGWAQLVHALFCEWKINGTDTMMAE